jgi:hypothetical protein
MGRAIIPLASHAIFILVFMALVRVIDLSMRWPWGSKEPLIFGTVPWRYAFDGIDLIILIVFGFVGVRDCYLELEGGEKK